MANFGAKMFRRASRVYIHITPKRTKQLKCTCLHEKRYHSQEDSIHVGLVQLKCVVVEKFDFCLFCLTGSLPDRYRIVPNEAGDHRGIGRLANSPLAGGGSLGIPLERGLCSLPRVRIYAIRSGWHQRRVRTVYIR